MHFLGYNFTFGQVIITIILSIISAIIYNKVISPSFSKFFDFMSRITKITKRIRIKNIQKYIDLCVYCDGDGMKSILTQNYIKSRMIFNCTFLLFMICGVIILDISERYADIMSNLYNYSSGNLRNIFIHEDNVPNYVKYKFLLKYVVLSSFLMLYYTLYSITVYMKKILYLSDTKKYIPILRNRIEKLNN